MITGYDPIISALMTPHINTILYSSR